MAEDRKVLRETDAEAIRLAKTLIRTARFGALAVNGLDGGFPQASRVATATDVDGAPLILTSQLSGHTGAILADPRCSLLVGEPGKGDPLAYPRMTLLARARRLERGGEDHMRARRRYLARHPKAELYADFGDFAFFRLEPAGASLNGGFGKAYALSPADLATGGDIAGVSSIEDGAVSHMNDDHAEVIALYAEKIAGAKPAKWRMSGLDPGGIDLVVGVPVARLWFAPPLSDAAGLRALLVELAKKARAAA